MAAVQLPESVTSQPKNYSQNVVQLWKTQWTKKIIPIIFSCSPKSSMSKHSGCAESEAMKNPTKEVHMVQRSHYCVGVGFEC